MPKPLEVQPNLHTGRVQLQLGGRCLDARHSLNSWALRAAHDERHPGGEGQTGGDVSLQREQHAALGRQRAALQSDTQVDAQRQLPKGCRQRQPGERRIRLAGEAGDGAGLLAAGRNDQGGDSRGR